MADKQRGQTRVATPGVLVARHVDAWLLGGIGVVLWLLFSWERVGGPAVPAILSGPLYWFLIALSGTHFGASYHLAYGQGRAKVRSHWFALIAVPAGLVLASLGIAAAAFAGADTFVDEGVRFLLAAVYTLTAWHYVKQVYGVVRLAASLRGLSLAPWAVAALRYGLYPLWLLEVIRVWSGRRGSSFDGFATSYEVLPAGLYGWMQLVAYLCIGFYVAVFVGLFVQWGRIPATVWTPYAVSFLWFMFPPSYTSVVLVFAALHGLQYLACAHRAELVWGVERGADDLRWWWFSAFGGAFATGMLLVYWLPRLLTDEAGATAVGTAPAALLFVLFNLHHYAVDAVIWRSGGEHIRRIVSGPEATTDATLEPAVR